MKYQTFRKNSQSLTLNDYLAVERTILANERTHLAYMQTVISFLVAALTLFKLLGGIEGSVAALILVVSASYFFIRGRKTSQEVTKSLIEFTATVDNKGK